ncbi:MAG: hypothetical protein QOF81_1647 [Acidimicrobiaceae bacterium]|jgi:hypothetical protein|nr:hypothetical protein [Acidimicrobiaceae bacterium]
MEASRTDGVWATVPDGVDGICRDAEGAVRAEVAQRIPLDRFGVSRPLGGPDGRR